MLLDQSGYSIARPLNLWHSIAPLFYASRPIRLLNCSAVKPLTQLSPFHVQLRARSCIIYGTLKPFSWQLRVWSITARSITYRYLHGVHVVFIPVAGTVMILVLLWCIKMHHSNQFFMASGMFLFLLHDDNNNSFTTDHRSPIKHICAFEWIGQTKNGWMNHCQW